MHVNAIFNYVFNMQILHERKNPAARTVSRRRDFLTKKGITTANPSYVLRKFFFPHRWTEDRDQPQVVHRFWGYQTCTRSQKPRPRLVKVNVSSPNHLLYILYQIFRKAQIFVGFFISLFFIAYINNESECTAVKLYCALRICIFYLKACCI